MTSPSWKKVDRAGSYNSLQSEETKSISGPIQKNKNFNTMMCLSRKNKINKSQSLHRAVI